MALSSLRYFSKGSTGLGGSTASTFDKFELSSNPKFHVGYKVEQADGSVYRYVHFGANTNRGLLVSSDISETSVADTDNKIIAPASAVNTTDGTLGSKFIQVTLAAVTANQFAGGKIVMTDDTGEGYTYDIVGNTATGTPASGDVRIELQQALQVAVDATTDLAIFANPYHNLEAATAGTDEIPVGVSCATATADQYGWIQTRGIVGILQDGTIALGDIVALSDGVAGAVHALAGGGTGVTDVISEPIVGACVDPGDDTGHGIFKINLE